MSLRVGILTGGGDCPGLNAVIRAVVRRAALEKDAEVLGVMNGWRGLIEDDLQPLLRESVAGILPLGGTILGTSRTNPNDGDDFPERIRATWKRRGLDALIVIGGEGTLRAARDMWHEHGLPLVGVPKTIDNDLDGTDFPFGFDTAVNTVMEAVDRLHSTAESHHRIMVIEVMGRHSGWIAAYGGIAGGADIILVPEHPFRISRVCELLRQRERQGSAFSIIVVAEDAHPHPDEDFLDEAAKEQIYRRGRLGGIGFHLAREIERQTDIDTRHANLGYTQRGGSPSAFDRVLATRFGVRAFELVLERQWGQMVALRCNKVISVPLDDAVRKIKRLDEEIYHVAEVFFG
ncbi:MAG TPA: ATP-dependent 6-phosphofructokinase [Pyrinomonadaceae bacterium]|jgi:6-phosphofructokinase 1|nr:ATP-dependent 6-phosphofructokinase [Pyrinomonadaceae bacterium]